MLRRLPALLAALALGLWLWRSDAVVRGCDGAPGDVSGAERYLPVLEAGEFELPRAVLVRMEPAKPGEISFTYFFSWEDEKHPLWLLDRPYALFRRLLYGSVEDLEYVRVHADEQSGKIISVEFEAPEVGRILVGHVYRKLEGSDIPLYLGRPALRVASWNHLFEPGEPCTHFSSVPVFPLSQSVCSSKGIPLRSRPTELSPRSGVAY